MDTASKNIVLIGGGGHCKSCIEVIRSTGLYTIAGILDLPATVGNEVLGVRVVGTDADIEQYSQQGHIFLITLGQIKSASLRQQLFDKVQAAGGQLATVIASTAYVSETAMLGEGTIIMHKAFVNAGAQLGSNNIINTGATLEHDVVIGNHNHISTGAYINGDCILGNDNFVGSGSVLANGISIGDKAVIGAGTVVVKSIKEAGTYFGNPARKISV